MGGRFVGRVAVVAVLALIAVGCGSSRDEDGETTSTTAADDGDAMFGTLPSPCGDEPEGTNTAADVGVTEDEIRIGFGDDAGFPQAAGLGQEMSDAVKALIEWCNDQGGINGRQITGKYYDARLLEVSNRWTEACNDKIFMMVGEGYALDASQEQIRMGCKLPAFPTYGVSPQFSNGLLAYFALPNPVDYQSVSEAHYYAETFPEKAKKVATMFANFSASIDTKDKQNATWPKVGITHMLDCQISFNIQGEPDWKPFAQKLKECGAELTRQCVLDHAAKVHDWDGGGLSGKADVGNNKPSICEAVMQLDGTKWVQVYPKKGGSLGCDPDNVQQATGDVVDKVHLGPDRKTHDFE